MTASAFARLLTANLGCQAGQRLVVVTDDLPCAAPTADLPDRTALAEAVAAAARALGLRCDVVVYAAQARSGIEPPTAAWDAAYPDGFRRFCSAQGLWQPLLDKTIDEAGLARIGAWLSDHAPAVDAVLAVSGRSVTHTRFRRLLTAGGHVRAATIPGVEPAMFEGVMTADWPLVAARSRAVASLLSRAASATIRSGRDRLLRLDLAGRPGIADTGVLTEPGAFGNLPGGEAFIAPIEGRAEGVLAVGPREDPDAARIVIKAGRLVALEGESPWFPRLREALDAHIDAANVAELGVGTNEKASAPDSILEAEKILGTVHVAFGDNAGFGGAVAVPFHQDYVVYGPSLELECDGETIAVLRNGDFLIDA